MRFVLLLILLLVTSCSGVFGHKIPYAEDVYPFVRRANFETIKEDTIDDIGSANVLDEINRIDNINEITSYRDINLRRETLSRPTIKEVSENTFPKIKDVPEYPKNFPDATEVLKEKKDLLNKKKFVKKGSVFEYNSLFTGLDDPLLFSTISEILQNKLPDDYDKLRPLLSCFIDSENLEAKDFEALSLVSEDRINNPYPILIKFYGENNKFRENIIENLLLLGVNPSLIYIDYSEGESVDKAEIYLYY